MERMENKLAKAARLAWWWLRQVMGDAAYENYLRSLRRKQSSVCKSHACVPPPPMSREQFYLDALRRRYSGISRCC